MHVLQFMKEEVWKGHVGLSSQKISRLGFFYMNCKRVGGDKKSGKCDGLDGPAISLEDPLVVPGVPVVEMHLFQKFQERFQIVKGSK